MNNQIQTVIPRQPVTVRLGNQTRILERPEIIAWEKRRAIKALRGLGVAIPDGDIDALRTAVVQAKLALGREEIERRLSTQIRWSDGIVGALARASGKRRLLCQVDLFLPHGTAKALPAWYHDRAARDDEAAFLLACPDHHIFRLASDGRHEVWETTGGSPLASRFFITVDDVQALTTPAEPSYPVQMAGTARLADGTVIGGVRHQFRDEEGGMRALLTVEYPWLIGPIAVAMHRWHVACEFAVWAESACPRMPAVTPSAS
jgi:hypothetical protein